MFKSWKVWSFVAVLGLALTASAYAMPMYHGSSSQPMRATMMSNSSLSHSLGTITKVDSRSMRLKIRTGNVDEEFAYAPSTTCKVDGQSAKVSDLKAGQEVLIDWSVRNGENLAANVRVLHDHAMGAASSGR